MTGMGVGDTFNRVTGGTQLGPVIQARDVHNPTFNTVQAAAAPVALAQLPAPVSGFTGRETELAEVTGLLDPAGEAGAVVVSAAVAGLARGRQDRAGDPSRPTPPGLRAGSAAGPCS